MHSNSSYVYKTLASIHLVISQCKVPWSIKLWALKCCNAATNYRCTQDSAIVKKTIILLYDIDHHSCTYCDDVFATGLGSTAGRVEPDSCHVRRRRDNPGAQTPPLP